jgi:zinc and cadmium transporter
MTPLQLVAAYCVLIVLASWLGGWLPSWVQLTHTRMQLVMSVVGGLMLGVGMLHMLPHSVAQTDSFDTSVTWALAGLLTTFFLIRVFDFHHHGPPESDASKTHAHDHTHGQEHAGHAAHGGYGRARRGWIGVALGLALHSLIDGVALGAAVLAESSQGHGSFLYGSGVFLAVLLHKPLDALSVTSLMAASGWPVGTRNLVNAGFAMTCPVGAMLVVLGIDLVEGDRAIVVGCALGFSAGVFLCIALGDLLPELQFHDHDRVKLSVALLVGVALAYLVGYFEPGHVHGASESPQRQSAADKP